MNVLRIVPRILGVVAVLAHGGVFAGEPLSIAMFQVDVTPPIGSTLCFGGVLPAKEIVDPLTARGVIFLVRPSPIVLCAVDWVEINNDGHDAWREALAKAAGTPASRVSVHTVHQHDAPCCDFGIEALLRPHGLGGAAFDPEFARRTIDRVAEAVRQAVAKPHRVTHLGIGKGKVGHVASNRRLLGPDGKVCYVRMSRCPDKAGRELPEGLIDPYVRLLSLWDGETPVACLSYYATHPQSYYNKGGVSADFVGMARSIREKNLPGVFQIYFTGAGGNVAVGKYNDGSLSNRPVLARRLADGMKAAWDVTARVPITADDIEWRVRPVVLPARADLDRSKLVATLDDRKAKHDHRLHAAIDLSWLLRAEAKRPIDLSCLRIGPAYVLHTPGELFVEYQLAAEQIRPASMVCLAAYGDCGAGYIGTEIAYTQGGYEVGYVSRVAPSVESVLMGAIRELLR